MEKKWPREFGLPDKREYRSHRLSYRPAVMRNTRFWPATLPGTASIHRNLNVGLQSIGVAGNSYVGSE